MDSDAKREAERMACQHLPTFGARRTIECALCGKTLLPGTAEPEVYLAAWAEVNRRLLRT